MNRITATKTTALTVAAVAAAVAVSACGGSSAKTAAAATTAAGAGQNGGQGTGQRAGRVPGTSGLIADVQGTTMQVQGASEQTALTFTTATKVTKIVARTASSLTVGVCVLWCGTGWRGPARQAPTSPRPLR